MSRKSRSGFREDHLDKKFQNMKQEINVPLSKKRKVDYSSFDKYSYQKQHQFNSEQLKLVEETIELIEQGEITTPSECLEKIQVKLRKSKKCIKIADKSPTVWKTATEYKTAYRVI